MLRRIIALIGVCVLMFSAECAYAGAADTLYPYDDGGTCRLIDGQGQIVAGDGNEYDYILTALSDSGKQRFIAFTEDRHGSHATLLNERGHAISDGDYDFIYSYGDVLMTVRGEQTGVMSWDGDELLPPRYSIVVPTGAGTYLTSTGDPGNGLADEIYLTGEDGSSTYLHLSADNIGRFTEGLASARARNGKYGYLDTKGQWAIAPEYDWADEFQGSTAVVTRGSYSGLIDRSGKIILPIRCDSIVAASYGGGRSPVIIAVTGETATIYDSATLVPLRTVEGVSYAYLPGFDLAVLANDETSTVYDSKGRAMLRAEGGQYLEILSADRALMLSDAPDGSRLVDMSGNTLLDGLGYAYALYDGSTPYAICATRNTAQPDADNLNDGEGDDMFNNARWGAYSLDGEELLPMEYDEIGALCVGLFAVRKDGYSGLVREDGTWLLRSKLTDADD